jgi:hypothetical protein
MMSTEKIPIRMNLEGEIAHKFEAVKKWLGLKQNTEVIRALISDVYRKIPLAEEKG